MPPHTRQQQFVLWVIWFALFNAVIVYQLALGGGIPAGENAHDEGLSPPVLLAVAQIVTASAIRWLLLPRAPSVPRVLVLMIIGLTLSEAVAFYGLFLVPAEQPGTKLALWIASLLSVAQFAPIYALARRPGNPFQQG